MIIVSRGVQLLLTSVVDSLVAEFNLASVLSLKILSMLLRASSALVPATCAWVVAVLDGFVIWQDSSMQHELPSVLPCTESSYMSLSVRWKSRQLEGPNESSHFQLRHDLMRDRKAALDSFRQRHLVHQFVVRFAPHLKNHCCICQDLCQRQMQVRQVVQAVG